MNDLFPASSELVDLARRLGAHPARLALWTEGAVAARLPGGRFAVSAAGSTLARLDARGIVELDLAKTQAILAQAPASSPTSTAPVGGGEGVPAPTPEEALTEAGAAPDGPAPCADVFAFADLFAFESVCFAAHTQPVAVNQILCSPRARQFADRRNLPGEVLACGPASVLVPFTPPGVPLAREIRHRILLWRDRHHTTPGVILLQNHGMITLGETIEEVLMRTEMTLKYAEIFLGAAMLGGPDFLKTNFITQIEATRAV